MKEQCAKCCRSVETVNLDGLCDLCNPHNDLRFPGDDTPTIKGRIMNRSMNDFEQACTVMLKDEQDKLRPDTALLAILCDAVRLRREHADAVHVHSVTIAAANERVLQLQETLASCKNHPEKCNPPDPKAPAFLNIPILERLRWMQQNDAYSQVRDIATCAIARIEELQNIKKTTRRTPTQIAELTTVYMQEGLTSTDLTETAAHLICDALSRLIEKRLPDAQWRIIEAADHIEIAASLAQQEKAEIA